jgi:hypothetical protein
MLAVLLLLAAPQEDDPTRGMPADVAAFIDRWQGCTHWSGEPTGGDPERDRQIARNVRDLCTGIEAAEKRMERRYAHNGAVRDRLGQVTAE